MTKKIEYLRIEFGNEQVYFISAMAIAEHCFEKYKKHDKDFNEDKNDYIEWMLTDEYKIADWAKNSMNWSDLVDHIIKEEMVIYDYDKAYSEAEASHIWEEDSDSKT